ncbi:helix-turn-helix domain-containing protein [Streptomyces sp. AD2-2]|nr:helix-turn-helix domain-containing protein [Streptomyces sp. AD2-2]
MRARRADRDPRQAGFPDDGSLRRVPGLRREELAFLAHVSVDYIVRLEQGRTRRGSRAVLDALADALHLAPDERTYLFTLAEVAPGASPACRVAPKSPRGYGSCWTPCTTSLRWCCTGAWTSSPGTVPPPPCSPTSAPCPRPGAT